MAVKIDADKCGHIKDCALNFANKAQSLKRMVT